MKIFLSFLFVYCKTHAILINTSKGYFNFRHTVDILACYNMLIDQGLKPENIKAVFAYDQIKNPRNPSPNKVLISQNENIEYFYIKPSKLSLYYILDVLELKHDDLMGISSNDNLFIYICGHGRDGFMKILNREFLYKDDLMGAISHTCSKVSKLLLILDTCQAESLVDRSILPKNAFVITTSLDNEHSYASTLVPKMGMNVIDDFIGELFKVIKKEGANFTISELLKKIEKLKSHITFNESSLNLSEFLAGNNKIENLKIE